MDRRAVRIDPVEVAVDVSQAWLGVVIEEGARQFWAGGGFVEARIARVVPGSPAEQAGLTAGLRVYKVEGEFVGSPDQLRGTLRRQLAGERLALEVIDPQQGGGTRRVVVRLVVRPPGAEGD